MAAHSASSRAGRSDRDRHRASAASVLLVLRGDGAEGMTDASVGPADALHSDKKPEEPRRFVHEVTESSSDESADEEQQAPPDASRAVIPTSPPMDKPDTSHEEEQEEEEVVVQEYYPTRNVADMHYLFTNDRLKKQPATVVLRSDPYCIPRVTDNVPEYRPRFNPLSILEAEEKLLPGYFRLDPAEGVPGAADSAAAGPVRLPLPSSAATSGSFVGKSTAFMGSMPRQQEFVEFPISENIFHSFKAGSAPPPTSPHPGLFASKLHHGALSVPDAGRDATGGAESPAALADAVLLSSMQHAADASAGGLEPLFPPSTLSLAADGLSAHVHTGDSSTDALTSQLPARPVSQGEHFLDDVADGYALFAPAQHVDSASAIPSLFVDDADGVEAAPATTPQHDAKVRASLQPVSKKPRSKNVFRQCTAPGCSKGARGKSGLCQRHGGGRRCAAPNCPKGAQGSSTMCLFHGGGYRCTVAGCMTGARGTSGLCAKHGGYKRAKDATADAPADAAAKPKRTKK